MYRKERHVKELDLSDDQDKALYQEVLNNPLCSILEERKLKKTDRSFGDDGQIESSNMVEMLVITWEERTLF